MQSNFEEAAFRLATAADYADTDTDGCVVPCFRTGRMTSRSLLARYRRKAATFKAEALTSFEAVEIADRRGLGHDDVVEMLDDVSEEWVWDQVLGSFDKTTDITPTNRS